MANKMEYRYLNREVSWLSFNERVLQEAEDETVPLIERLRFLGIFSNNLDEFFRVRVASIKRIASLNKGKATDLAQEINELLDVIQHKAVDLQQKFEEVYAKNIEELKVHNIFIVNEKELNEKQLLFVNEYFNEKVRPVLAPIILDKKSKMPKLVDKVIYLAIKMERKEGAPYFAIIEIPAQIIPRFLILPAAENNKMLMLLDDVIRYGLPQIFTLFKYQSISAYTFKLTRDAELDVDDDISISWVDKISKSLKKRKLGKPVRLVYDQNMPNDLREFLFSKLSLNKSSNVIPGGRYHNFKDYIDFPNIGAKSLRYKEIQALKHPMLRDNKSLIETISKRDIFLYFPYQSFNYIISLLREAAIDPKVKSIKINLYRVAKRSRIINALINAARNGKQVTVILEIQARFDEENNIKLSKQLQDEDVTVIFGVQGLKVHSKLILITRKEQKHDKLIAHIGSGNFHEKNAKIYTDCSLITCDQNIAKEVDQIFSFFRRNYERSNFKHLLVSPFNFRKGLVHLIDTEIENSKKGLPAFIDLKLNNLVDLDMINKLYDASNAGVQIRIIVRGICSLISGAKGMSENIHAISIVDRFLEHSRVMIFGNNEKPKYFISSADWMQRNIDKRVEVTTPVFDKSIQKLLKNTFNIQWNDNKKARVHTEDLSNKYVEISKSEKPIVSQQEVYKYFKKLLG